MARISDLPGITYPIENILTSYDNSRISLENLFEWIKTKALESGLTVEYTGQNIIFINGKKPMNNF